MASKYFERLLKSAFESAFNSTNLLLQLKCTYFKNNFIYNRIDDK